MQTQKIYNKPKVWCVWHLNRDCNFRCSYCIASSQRDQGNEPGHGVEKDVKAFKRNNINWQEIHMSGGEPFIYPDFIRLCKELTAFSKIRIVTNLSTNNVYDFANIINPNKVIEINCGVHIGQRPRNDYDEMIDKILYLRKKGFHVFINQVIHPKIFNEYKKDFEYFKNKGNILITPKVIKGIIGLKDYPQGYSKREKQEILKYAKSSASQPSLS